MQYLAKAVQYYKDINPATLTGAIDVIVVERPSDDGGVELACSPFHVRFGKLSVLRPVDKKVRITVNDDPIPFFMKVGETGEAFFVFETDADLPESMQTSPLAGPVADDEAESPGEPEFLDLGASETAPVPGDEATGLSPRRVSMSSTESSPSHSRYASMNQTRLSSPTATFRPLPTPLDQDPPTESDVHRSPMRALVPEAASALLDVAGKASSLGRAAITKLSSNRRLESVVNDSAGTDQSNGHQNPEQARAEQELGELEKQMREDLGGLELDDSEGRHAPNETGDEVRNAARAKDADVRSILSGKTLSDGGMGGSEAAQVVSNDEDGELLASEVNGVPEKAGDLMLDMSGYKIGEDTLDKSEPSSKDALQDELRLSTELDEPAFEKELVTFTQALLQSADPKTLAGFFGPDEPSALDRTSELGRAASASTYLNDVDRSFLTSHRTTSATSLPTLIEQANGGLEESTKDHGSGEFQTQGKEFSLKVGGVRHVFELSLGGGQFGHDRTRDDIAFAEQQVTSSQFMTQDTLTGHSSLVVKYAGRYLTWENGSPILASLAVYRKSLVDHPEYHRIHLDPDVCESLADDASGKQSSRGWGLWWGKKGAGGPADSTVSLPGPDASPLTSPPVSQPSSPRSLPLPTSPMPISPLAGPSADAEVPEKRHYAKTLRLTSDQLKTLNLKKGMNVISFSVRSSYSGFAICTSRIFLWESDYQVVISDIDGTITKSDALGHVFTMIGRDWTHLGVAKLYTDIARNGYKMMYLTSRAIGQADTTREYLKGIKQNGFQLPEGPVIMSPDRLMTSLHREVVLRKPEVFKMACLRDIQRLFSERSPFPFYSGFGNRITDALSYRSVDIPSSRIFTIDTNGEVKMELLELAGYKSSYIHMTDLVDQMFPPINRKTAPDYTDFNFWREPVMQFELPDLTPPSPALSARSDNSSRLGLKRLGSLATSLSRRSSRTTLVDGTARTKAGTPSSPLLQAIVVEEPNGMSEDELDQRSESSSMPGSLPNDGDFESRYLASKQSQAEQYRNEVQANENGEYDEEAETAGAEEEGDEFGEEMDFSSVPYL